MSFIVPRERFIQDLCEAFSFIASDAVLLHTRVTPLGVIDQPKPRDEMLSDYWRAIQEAADEKTLLFPTFNYDYCRVRTYRVRFDPCQVGQLNEFVRQRFPDTRTETPVFNFCIINNRGFQIAPYEKPLSTESTFGELLERDGTIGLLGVSMEANTFAHFAEEVCGVGYRYDKRFPGVVDGHHCRQHVDMQFRVRPLEPEVLDYDIAKLIADLSEDGILHRVHVGKGSLALCRAQELFDYWSARLKKDELYMLTQESRQRTRELFDRVGYPLTLEGVEGCREAPSVE